ncbi:hypothetical protein OIU78_016746 [Salix suchowensis]|nr:hypothetical protein OIU78_016746 [Salix suchowensis]
MATTTTPIRTNSTKNSTMKMTSKTTLISMIPNWILTRSWSESERRRKVGGVGCRGVEMGGLRQDRLCPFATVKFLGNPNTDEVDAKIGSVPLPNTDLDLAHDRGL